MTSELCAFWVFLDFCEAANIEKPQLDGQCSCSQYHRDYALSKLPTRILGVWVKHVCSGDLASQASTCFLFF